jgi:hypothetical protein
MSSYVELMADLASLASKYGLGAFVSGFQPEHINFVMGKYSHKIKDADSYDKCIELLNDTLRKTGLLTVESFITNEEDRKKLYELYKTWRNKLLKGDAK